MKEFVKASLYSNIFESFHTLSRYGDRAPETLPKINLNWYSKTIYVDSGINLLSTNVNLLSNIYRSRFDTIHMYSGITSGRVFDRELLYTKILEVNLFAIVYRQFHRDFSPINEISMKQSVGICPVDWREIAMKQSVGNNKQINF